MKKIFGFTLAEIMIVLIVLGVLAAVLLPAAKKVRPDENVINFKKTNKVFIDAVTELITSDNYFINLDFNYDVDGNNLRSATSKYFVMLLQMCLRLNKIAVQQQKITAA